MKTYDSYTRSRRSSNHLVNPTLLQMSIQRMVACMAFLGPFDVTTNSDEQKNAPELPIGRFLKSKSLGGNRVILGVELNRFAYEPQ